MEISRITYSLLDWISDIGGLFDGLNAVVAFFLKPLAVYTLNTKLTSLTVRFRNRNEEHDQYHVGQPSDKFVRKISTDLAKS